MVIGIHPIISMPVSDMEINWWLSKPLVRAIWGLREHQKRSVGFCPEGFDYRMTKSKISLVGEAAPAF
jgi:hypothetical protein